LARHNQELATLQGETSNKIKQAIAEAKNEKESLQSGLQEEEAKIEIKFQMWKEELKMKRKEESDKVAYEAFKVVQEQAGSTIEADISSNLHLIKARGERCHRAPDSKSDNPTRSQS
jgi:hypothetical protein